MYNVFRQVNPRISDPYNERIFAAIYDGTFYIELIIVIGSSSITLSKFKKVRKRKAIYSYLVALAPVVQTLDRAIQRISITEINYAIRWIVIYPVDSAIRRLNNRGLN